MSNMAPPEDFTLVSTPDSTLIRPTIEDTIGLISLIVLIGLMPIVIADLLMIVLKKILKKILKLLRNMKYPRFLNKILEVC